MKNIAQLAIEVLNSSHRSVIHVVNVASNRGIIFNYLADKRIFP